MSDMAEQFFTAWTIVFGPHDTKRLFCSWHIDKSWRKGLTEHVEKKQNRVEIYHQLRLLLQETNEARFQVILQPLLSYLLESYPCFYTYFKDTYVPHTSQWSFCYRTGAMVNTNIFVEAFHCKPKSVYFQSKQNC